TVYSDTPDHDPAELLDAIVFPTAEAIEDHLLATFVPTVYRHDEDLDRAQQWFGYLARHLARLGTHDLAWWQLPAAVRLPRRMLVTAAAVGLMMGLTDFVVEGLLFWQVNVFGVVFATVLGLLTGLAFAFALSRYSVLEPSRVRVRIRGRTKVRAR